METKNSAFSDINEIKLVNVTLKKTDFSDPILEAMDFDLPTDQILVIESSKNDSAALFLKCLAGQIPVAQGKILWNDENIFTAESAFDPRLNMGCYFESYCAHPNETIYSLLKDEISENEINDVLEYFDLTDYSHIIFKNLAYKYQKLAQLIKSAYVKPFSSKQILILEDPASGLDESHWLCFLDFIQQQQRRGFLRHIFMTNYHPTALRHMSHHSMLIEDGLIYFEQPTEQRKINHF